MQLIVNRKIPKGTLLGYKKSIQTAWHYHFWTCPKGISRILRRCLCCRSTKWSRIRTPGSLQKKINMDPIESMSSTYLEKQISGKSVYSILKTSRLPMDSIFGHQIRMIRIGLTVHVAGEFWWPMPKSWGAKETIRGHKLAIYHI